MEIFIFTFASDSPVCSDQQRRTYGAARNEEVNVSCSVDADPPDVVFRWQSNGSIFESQDVLSVDRSSTAKSVARFVPKTKSDFGPLYCYAKNEVGNMKEPCVFNIVPTGKKDSHVSILFNINYQKLPCYGVMRGLG